MQMNKIQTIVGGSFFIVEAIVIMIFLLDVSVSSIEVIVPWILGIAINTAFLIVLLFGAFGDK